MGLICDDDGLPAGVRAALEAYRGLARALHDATTPKWAHLDLTMGQLKAMLALSSTGAINVSGLAERLELSKPATSILVDRLVQLRYVERTEDLEDRRRTLVDLTPQGGELVAQLQQSGGSRMAHWLEQLSATDLEALTRGLRALAEAITREGTGRDEAGVPSATTSSTGMVED